MTQRIRITDLIAMYGLEAELEISTYSCGAIFQEPLTEDRLSSFNEQGVTVVRIDAEDN